MNFYASVKSHLSMASLMKNASFYVLAILVFGLIGNPMYHQAFNYKSDNVIGVNAFAESEDDSQKHDGEKENEDHSDSEDKSSDNTDTQSEDNSDSESDDNHHSENATKNEPDNNQSEDQSDSEDHSDSEVQSEQHHEDQLTNSTDNTKQKSEAKSEQIISQLEQKITQLEKRIQDLLEKVQNGQYYGNTDNTSTTKSYVISFDGTATSVQDNSVSAPVSADIFAENIMNKDGYSKLRVTGGHIDIGKTTYDIVFGKARVTDNSQGSSILLVAEIMDDSGDITTVRVNLDSAQSFDMADSQPINLQIQSPQSKIAGQWALQGTGSLSS